MSSTFMPVEIPPDVVSMEGNDESPVLAVVVASTTAVAATSLVPVSVNGEGLALETENKKRPRDEDLDGVTDVEEFTSMKQRAIMKDLTIKEARSMLAKEMQAMSQEISNTHPEDFEPGDMKWSFGSNDVNLRAIDSVEWMLHADEQFLMDGDSEMKHDIYGNGQTFDMSEEALRVFGQRFINMAAQARQGTPQNGKNARSVKE